MIDKEKNYSISEVSKITGYDPHVLRYYEDDFNLKIPRTHSNRRYYTYKEIEKFMYIKQLQEKGLTNKQIKLVLESPEIIVNNHNEVAATKNECSQQDLHLQENIHPNNNYIETIHDICNQIHETINLNIHNKLEETKSEIINYFDNLIKENNNSNINSVEKKEKDILICENARLKMKLKEKSYEIAELKEKLNRLSNKNIPFWKKIFS